jgi:glycosyltransferase involved in cell wall biosynthesis
VATRLIDAATTIVMIAGRGRVRGRDRHDRRGGAARGAAVTADRVRLTFLLPGIATNVGGRLIPPADPAALAGTVLELLAAPKRSAELGWNGRERIRRHFPERAMADAEDRLIRLHLKDRRA